MNAKCSNCWRYDVCSQEDQDKAKEDDYPCYESPDNDDAQFDRLREERRGL